ncbi:MAG TPA: response regulator transcription factor [Thermoanaerobaculia bacterium]|jgi:DNA-binding NarL/FixJ family response regulator|nr:response regulator transcription factor [Thermoanaerobaculia bacterium]
MWNGPGRPIRVVVADDHPIVRHGIVDIIGSEKDMEVVGQAGDGEAALDAVLRLAPDVTLMDLRMPLLSGVEAIRAIRRKAPSSVILVLTTFDTDTDIREALRAGAKGYLLKDLYREELLDAVRRAAMGMRVMAPAVSAAMERQTAQAPLTVRELDVLRLVASGHSNMEIAVGLAITAETVKGHLKNIFGKLEAADRTEATVVALRRGILRL